jgi:hypothetical protein
MQMVIANRLSDGRVVFLDAGDRWVTSIDAGRLLDDGQGPAALATAKEHEAQALVVEPTLIEVEVSGARRRPVAMREAIRAFGPTMRPDLADSPALPGRVGAGRQSASSRG